MAEIDSDDWPDSMEWIESLRTRTRPLTTAGSGAAAADVFGIDSACSIVVVTVAFVVRVRRRFRVGGSSEAGGAAVSTSD